MALLVVVVIASFMIAFGFGVQRRSSRAIAFAQLSTPGGSDDRRRFLDRSLKAMIGLGISGLASSCGFFFSERTGFRSVITVGLVGDIKAGVIASDGFFYVPEGRMWITEYPAESLAEAKNQYEFYDQVAGGLEAGLVALYQTCPHLGCRVPECTSSQWFECPCHGSKYNQVGENQAGPAPRGMDRFPMSVAADGLLLVDTGKIITGPPIGTNTTGQEAAGQFCIT